MSKQIRLTQGKVAIVDDADFDQLNQHKWYAMKQRNGDWYAARHGSTQNGKRISIYMHREILKPLPNMETDHCDHDGLNNRRSNLRMATIAQNLHNQRKCAGFSSRYKGVSWHRRNSKWRSRITIEGKLLHLGYFDSQIEAAQAYDRITLKYFGEFAYTNF